MQGIPTSCHAHLASSKVYHMDHYHLLAMLSVCWFWWCSLVLTPHKEKEISIANNNAECRKQWPSHDKNGQFGNNSQHNKPAIDRDGQASPTMPCPQKRSRNNLDSDQALVNMYYVNINIEGNKLAIKLSKQSAAGSPTDMQPGVMGYQAINENILTRAMRHALSQNVRL